MVITSGWGDYGKELFFNGYRISDLQDEKVLERCFATTRIHLKLLNWILKNGENGKFYVIWFFNHKEKNHVLKNITKMKADWRGPIQNKS